MKKKLSKNYVLLLLALMFAAPGITAYIFFQHPAWLGASTVNKGTLLSPPIELNSLAQSAKWRIIYWSPQDCEKSCIQQLDLLARVRLALGRKLYQVDQWLLLGDRATPVNDQTHAVLKEQDFHIAQLRAEHTDDSQHLPNEPRIYIANPDNYLILSYTAQVNPDDIYKDLKILLNTSEAKSNAQ